MTRVIALLLALGSTLSAADWDPAAAARFLDDRQKEWFSWPRAKTPEGTCVSCHTGMPYLLARPALRKRLGEAAPTEWETKLLDRLRDHAGDERKVNIQGPEIIFGALFLGRDEPAGEAAGRARTQLAALRREEGPLQGVWQWYSANLEPWESPGSFSFGAALGGWSAAATGAGPEALAPTVAWLREHRAEAPLHNRLAMLWASPKLPGLFTEGERRALIEEVLAKQQADGSWTIASLGPWMEEKNAPPQPAGGHPYATAVAAFVLEQTGVRDPGVGRARAWLASHQDRETGAWLAPSMNKVYPQGSVESKFMQDAATAFAALALLN